MATNPLPTAALKSTLTKSLGGGLTQAKQRQQQTMNQFNNLLGDLQDNEKALGMFLEEFRKNQREENTRQGGLQRSATTKAPGDNKLSKSVDGGISKLARILRLAKEKKFLELRQVANQDQVASKTRNSRFSD